MIPGALVGKHARRRMTILRCSGGAMRLEEFVLARARLRERYARMMEEGVTDEPSVGRLVASKTARFEEARRPKPGTTVGRQTLA
jgi:hypothetical protein